MDLASRVREEFGIALIGVHPTGLGADACAVLWRGLTADGCSYAVKTSVTAPPGLAVAHFLAQQGIRGVPGPVRALSGRLAVAHDGGVVSVAPWLAGQRVIDTGLDREQWQAFGTLLGAVHATAPTPALAGTSATATDARAETEEVPSEVEARTHLPIDRHDPTAEAERARAFPGRLHRAVAAAPGDAVLSQLASLWARSADDILAIADLAETSELTTSWDGATPAVICHADPHHGNLLLADDGGVWLVDWDDAVLAPREADLIFVIGGIYSFAPITPHEVGWFFDGYTPASGGVTQSDLDADRLTYYRSVRALTDFLDFAELALDGGRPEPDRSHAVRIAAGALSVDGIVALTLSEAAVQR